MIHNNLSLVGLFNLKPSLIAAHAQHDLAMSVKRFIEADAGMEAELSVTRANTLAVSYGTVATPYKPYLVTEGVAVIPVHGVLINSFGDCYGYITGYNFIRRMTDLAEADEDVLAIGYDCSSPGGMVQGCFETVDLIASCSKPTAAFVDSQATSACYAIASACDHIYVTESAMVGSVGVVQTHLDYSKYLQDEGIAVTLNYRGDRKVDGNPYGPLEGDALAAQNAELDKWYDRFTDSVAANRKMDKKAVVDTQAGVFYGQESVTIGFSDSVVTLRDGFNQFVSGLNKSEGGGLMGEAVTPVVASVTTPAATTTVASTDAVANERQRIAGILGCAESASNPALASHFALSTSMSIEDAQAALVAASKDKPAAQASAAPAAAQPAGAPAANSAFAAAMATGNPNIGADANDADTSSTGTEMTTAQRVIQSQKLARGGK